MKKAISISLILLLSAQSLYRLGLISYFDLNREYIARVLCANRDEPIPVCYGNCFLQRNLSLADQHNTDQKKPAETKVKVEVPVFLVGQVFALELVTVAQKGNTFLVNFYSPPSGPGLFHPPIG